ncbi:MAG: radical SAM/SPASM domain-containing protein [Anaerolineae bacterium]
MMKSGARRSLLEKLFTARWDTIIRGFYEYNLLRHFRVLPPRQLQINVTYRCNARCTMCNIWQMEPRTEMALEDFDRVLNDSIFRGIERLTLAGGEPSLRPDLVPLTMLFMDKMPRLGSLTLITNGLAVERILAGARALLDLCVQRGIHLNISVSLDGVGHVHDEMRDIPGAFARVERCLMGLKELQAVHPFWLGAGCVITRKNLYHLRELQDWCEERGIELGFQLVGFHETYVANVEQREELDFTQTDKEYLFAFLQELAAERSPSNFMAYYWHDMLKMYRDGRPRQTPCPFAVDSFVLDAYGDVYYCLSERKIGNCLTEDISDSSSGGLCSAIYYRPENLRFREALTRSSCLCCNSGCFVNIGIKKDLKKYLWFLLTGR